MCCCERPTINGQPGYRWNNPSGPAGVYPVNPPDMPPEATLLYDEPGRCVAGLDSHCHHYRLVRHFGSVTLLVRHGGGDESVRLCHTATLLEAFAQLDTNARYLIFNAIYHAYSHGKREEGGRVGNYWRMAAAEKRIRTRKIRNTDTIRVWVE